MDEAGCCLFAGLCQDCRTEACCIQRHSENGYGDQDACERYGKEVGQQEISGECIEI